MRTGLRPNSSGYGAMVYLASVLQAQLVVPLAVMGAFVLARRLTAHLDRIRRATFDTTALILHYSVGQGLVGWSEHGFPANCGRAMIIRARSVGVVLLCLGPITLWVSASS